MGEHVVVENCLIDSPMVIGRGSMVSNVAVVGERKVELPGETLLYGVPIGGGKVVTVLMGVEDDPKTDRTFCNMGMQEWLMRAGVRAEEIWPRGEFRRVLWNAQLFPAVKGQNGVESVGWFMRPERVTKGEREAWRKGERFSMADILESADAEGMAAHRDTLSAMLQATEWIAAVKEGRASSVQSTINHFGVRGYQRLVDQLYEAGQEEEAGLVRARLLWSLAEIEARPHFPRELVKSPGAPGVLQRKAFEAIRDAMDVGEIRSGRVSVKERGVLTASAPVRLDFTGGWTDTPPYCLENGGRVVNIAINLNDAEPIRSTFRVLEEPIARLVSRDLGKTMILSDPKVLSRAAEPGNSFGLHLTAMRLTGMAPLAGENSQKKWLRRIAGSGGFELTTASNLPAGSGMGTSSILGATTLAVLRTALGMSVTRAELFEQTLLLEQQLSTGGGWQDQVGGIAGGVKMIETRPGIPQVLRVRQIPLSAAQVKGLEERLVVYFTGQQRLAKNILREVMGRYLSREPGTMVLFNELAHSGRACEEALRESDWLSVATEINRYWRIKKELFPGSTTPVIDALFLEMRAFYLGGCLAGAGGGGFAYFLCADAGQAHRLRTELARVSMRPGSLGLTFSATVNRRGLRVVRG